MPKDEGLKKHTLNLRDGDMDKIREFYPDVHAAIIVRMVVSNFVDKINKGTPTNPIVDIDL